MFPAEVIAGSRAVVTIAQHFVELKQVAQEKLATGGASARGYFTPSEDEEVRHLLVSYWQSRNVLVELVARFRHDDELLRTDRPAAFLVAYTATLVLVDAARFLRENFLDRPIVLTKLNEPEPHFGIAAGTFDRVQQSLTSPIHAWHMYNAIRYFEQHETELRALAAGTELAGPLEIIDRLQHRLAVNLVQYTTHRTRVRSEQFATGLRRDLLARALYGLQRAGSRLISDRYTVPQHHPQLPADVAAELQSLLQPGDVLITRKEHALTNYFLPGFWPHAALYLGTPSELERLGLAEHVHLKPRWRRLLECDEQRPERVLEALKDGVRIRSLASPWASDALLVLRPQLPADDIAQSLARGMFHEGKPYDFDFDFTRSDRLVCTEVVYRSYEGVGGTSFTLTRRAGRLTLSAEDLVAMALERRTFAPLAVYAPAHGAGVLQGAAAEDVIRRTLAARLGAGG